MKNLILILILSTIIFSCKNDKNQKVKYDKTTNEKSVIRDTTLNEISDLPIEIDSTEYLIYPIGKYNFYDGGSNSKIYSGSSNSYGSFSNTSQSGNDIFYGEFSNLKFQQINSDSITKLTDKYIKIQSFTFLRKIFENIGKQYIIYVLNDSDTNNDRKITDEDIKSLYISKVSGENFIKLTSNNQELIDWKIITNQNKLYYRSIEDIDKNGDFNQDDKLHYFFIDFNNMELKSKEYNPI